MKKYLSLLLVALFATLSFTPLEVSAQSNQQKTITIAEIRQQMESEIAKEREGEAQLGQKSDQAVFPVHMLN